MQPAVSEVAARNRLWFALMAVLSFAGIVLSAVSLQRHYARSASEFCDFSQKFSCDIVNRSEYSEVQGIPVAAIGVLGYATLFFLSTFWNSRAETPNRLLAASIVGLVFALHLTYIEAYELKTWCILCVASQVMIFLITVFAAIVKLRRASA
ncbi:MAG: vitamin K epoxide reductase family protein [Acidobacteriia bacterium]|nr:vitamin K epoxide reductase family protein [Terriglobia bacterium]